MEEKVKEILKQVLQMDQIDGDISSSSCEKWDSMAHINLIVELEMNFDVSFEPEEIAEMSSLSAIVAVLNRKSNGI